jgi:uncharacterized membrane protein (UPF0127 family)
MQRVPGRSPKFRAARTAGVVELASPGERRAVVCDRCRLAETPVARLRGLMGAPRLGRGEGLLLLPAAAVHTLFMRFPIDVVFLDRNGTVVGAVECLRPWRFSTCRGASAALELPAGAWGQAGGRVGDLVRYSPALL